MGRALSAVAAAEVGYGHRDTGRAQQVAHQLALVAVASLQLGSALTPTPEPREGSTLRTTGLYGVFGAIP